MKALLKSPYTCDEGGGKLRIFQLGNDDNRYHEQAWFTDPIKAGKAVWSEPYFDMKMSGIVLDPKFPH